MDSEKDAARRFQVDEFCVGFAGVDDFLRVGADNKSCLDVEFREIVGEKFPGWTVGGIDADDMVAGFDAVHDCGSYCGHSRGENEGSFGFFEHCQFFLDDGEVWVADSGVNVAFAGFVGVVVLATVCVEIWLNKERGLEDWRSDGPELVGFFAEVLEEGVSPHVLGIDITLLGIFCAHIT